MGNILGENFHPKIKKQIDVRQESLGTYSNIPSKDLIYYQNKTPFLKLASSVNLESKGENTILLKDLLGVNENDIVDGGLAKKCILHGGVVDKSTPIPQSGLRFKNDNLFSGAYGWGGGERGFVPQPGITGADVTYYNNGALSKCTVNIKCFSREQFAIIDALYMRPGFGVLLEFGWSLYLSNDNKVLSTPQFNSPALDQFFKKETKDNFAIYKLIQKGRLDYDGNYDGVYGKISKFDWRFNNDGSYDITIQITGYGSTIESLKVVNPYIKTTFTPKEEEKDFYEGLEEILSIDNLLKGEMDSMSKISILHQKLYDLKTNLSIPNAPLKLNLNSIITNNTIIQINPQYEGKTSNTYNSYISFKDLLFLIRQTILIQSEDNKPLVDFDMLNNKSEGAKDFFVFPNNAFSSNPQKVLVPINLENFLNGGLSEKENQNIKFLNEETPLKKVRDWKISKITDGKEELLPKDSELLGDLRYIYLNIDEIIKIITSSMDDKNNITVFDLLNDILNLINTSLGGVNNLTLRLDNDSGLIKIIDLSPLMLINDGKEIANFNLYGFPTTQKNGKVIRLGNFIRNVDLSSGLTDEFATMIAIGAASNSVTISSNSTSFKNYNEGLKDRIIPKALLPSDKEESSDSETYKKELEKNIEEYKNKQKKNALEDLKKLYVDLQFDFDVISSFTTFNEGYQQLLLQKHSLDKATSPFFIPFNLKLTMDGLGGMKLYQRFSMDQKILPPMYNDQTIDLIIRGINHSITPSGWTTTLDSLSVPKSTAE
jgi:hypothetical protein